MPRRRSKTLTDSESQIMDVIWSLGSASVRQVTEQLAKGKDVTYNTVQTIMGILEQKGYLERHKDGRAFVYEAVVSRDEAQSQVVDHVVGQFFGGSRRDLLLNLLGSDEIDADEIDDLRRLLEERGGQR